MIAIGKKRLIWLVLLLLTWFVSSCTLQDDVSVADLEDDTTDQIATITLPMVPTLIEQPENILTPTITSTEEPSAAPSPTPTPETDTGRESTEVIVLQLSADRPVKDFKISPNGLRFAYTVVKDEKTFVVLDEIQGEPYDEVSQLTFSPDNQHLVYVAKDGDKEFVVFDGIAQQAYDDIVRLYYSSDNSRFAYSAYLDTQRFLILDGEEIDFSNSNFELVLDFVLSPDLQHVAFAAANINDEWFVLLDGEKSKPYDDIREQLEQFMSFSPDSQHFVFQGRKGEHWYMVVDGQESDPLDDLVFDVVFSPDSLHIAHDMQKNGKMSINLDGDELENFDRALDPVFSPDSQHFAYKAKDEIGWFIVFDGKAGKTYDGFLVDFTFSPDSQKFAYIVDLGDQEMLVLDGKEKEPYQQTRKVVFSPDSQRAAYIVYDGNLWYMIVDEEISEGFDNIPGWTSFSPDSEHVIYMISELGIGESIYVDNVPGKIYNIILPYEYGFSKSKLIFYDENGNIFYYAVGDGAVYRVEEKLNE